jgi:hypothetical protein
MPAVLQNLIGKMGPQPIGGQTPPTPAVPAGLQAGSTPGPMSGVLQKISGMLGGGNPAQDQNNAYVKGKVDEYMANLAATKARAQQKGAQAAARELKKGQANLAAPQMATPGTGQTATTPLQQLWQGVQSQVGK